MGKSRTRKRGAVERAIALRAEYRKWLIIFIVSLAVCVAVVLAYMVLLNYIEIPNTGIMPWITAVIAAGFIGVAGNKFSRLHREYLGTLDMYGLTDEQVKKRAKNG